MTTDALATFKENQKKSWGLFAPIEIFTTMPAATLVNFSGLKSGQKVLDVGCGTGVVAITAARFGAKVSAMDLSPVLIERANENAAIAEVQVNFQEGDVESLSYADDSFDVVLSQYGHMFAPRPEVAIKEMLRVLKPGGTIAFSTWPPDLYVGRFFSLVAKYSPAPEWVSPPTLWGDPNFVRQQLGNRVENLTFDQGTMFFTALSFGHYRKSVESTIGPLVKLLQESKDNSEKINQFRQELANLAREYYVDNHFKQHFLMSKAFKSNKV